jgi:hypothetical protein
MIKKLLIIPLMLMSVAAFSQKNGDAIYSFGVRGYNYLQLPELLNQSGNHHYINSNFSSYIIKFNDNLFSYRLNGSYLNQSTQFSNNCDNCELANGKVKDYSFKAGFEKNFNYSAFQPYFAFDLGYRSNEFDGLLTNVNPQNLNVNTWKRGFTITPVFGIKLSPIKEVSIFAESNLELFYAWGKTEYNSQTDSNLSSANKFRKGEYLFNPVSVGIQIHLGRKN